MSEIEFSIIGVRPILAFTKFQEGIDIMFRSPVPVALAHPLYSLYLPMRIVRNWVS